MSLVEEIERAHRKNERKLVQDIKPPRYELTTEEALYLRHFAAWCQSRGVKFLPCSPVTLAAFIRFENAAGVSAKQITEAVRAVEIAHDNAAIANPAATAAVRVELGRVLDIEAPRSWPKADRPHFNSLPIEVRAVIARRAEQDSLALRRLQNRVADLSKERTKECPPKTTLPDLAMPTPMQQTS